MIKNNWYMQNSKILKDDVMLFMTNSVDQGFR